MALADKRQQENITEDEGKKRTEGKERSKNWEKQTTFRTTNQKTETKNEVLEIKNETDRDGSFLGGKEEAKN